MEWWTECAYRLALGNHGMAIFVAIFVPPFALLAFMWIMGVARRRISPQSHASKTLPAKVSVLLSVILLAPGNVFAGQPEILHVFGVRLKVFLTLLVLAIVALAIAEILAWRSKHKI